MCARPLIQIYKEVFFSSSYLAQNDSEKIEMLNVLTILPVVDADSHTNLSLICHYCRK